MRADSTSRAQLLRAADSPRPQRGSLSSSDLCAGITAYDGSGFRLSKTPARFTSAAPCLGEHNFQVATEILGLTPDEVADLIVEQVLY